MGDHQCSQYLDMRQTDHLQLVCFLFAADCREAAVRADPIYGLLEAGDDLYHLQTERILFLVQPGRDWVDKLGLLLRWQADMMAEVLMVGGEDSWVCSQIEMMEDTQDFDQQNQWNP